MRIDPESLRFYFDILLSLFLLLNAYFALRIRKEILDLKLFIYENFIRREDAHLYFHNEKSESKK